MIDTILVFVLLTDFFILATSRLGACVRAAALQALLLATLPLLIRETGQHAHALALAGGTVLLKAVVIPHFLLRAIRRVGVDREVAPLVGYVASVALGGVLAVVSFGLGTALPLAGAPLSVLLVPVAFTTLLLGLLVLVSRTKALNQVVGYLMLENGIFLFGLVLVRELPFIVELGILLDIFVGAFVMGIVIHHISEAFDHIDTHELATLRH
jgi:hydrogenase-4 component E